MLARCATYALDGIQARRVIIECDVRPGLPSFSIVGLGDTAARSLRETVRAAVLNAGYDFPAQRITLNIAPASLRTTGPSTALAAALALLAASGQVSASEIAGVAVFGELSLSGEIRPVAGTLAAAVAHSSSGGSDRFVHAGDPLPYGLAPNPSRTVTHLGEFSGLIDDGYRDICALPTRTPQHPDFSDVRGHGPAIFALTVAAVAGHAILLRGRPGSGKTMLARRLPTILPELTEPEQREVAVIRDAVGLGRDTVRPFRAPHHTISAAGLVGGGSPARPGEVTLAHRGVLFLDSIADLARPVLEALRGPLDQRSVTIVRGQRAHHFPADFQLVAATTPCPCGHLGSDRCRCDEITLMRYRRRLSAPLLDRLSMIVDLPADIDLARAAPAPSSAVLRDKVSAARERRLAREAVARRNDVAADDLALRGLSACGEAALSDAYLSGLLSARGRFKVLHVAQSVADLADEPTITGDTIRTALGLRGDLMLGTTVPVLEASGN